MRGPTPKFYLGFGSKWTTLDASIVWTEITGYVMSERGGGTSRGRSSELDDMRAGTANFVLNNSTRRFDPTYTTGPYAGQLLPGVPVKITGTANGTEYPILRGFVNGWPQDYDPSNKLGVVNVTVTDGFGKLATAATPSSVYALEVDADSPKAWWPLAESVGSTMGEVVAARTGTYSPTIRTAEPGLYPYADRTAIAFDDTGYGEVTDSAVATAAGGDATFEMIVRFDEDTTALSSTPVPFFHQRGPGVQEMYARLDLLGGIDFVIYATGLRSLSGSSTVNLRDGVPHLLTFRRSGGTNTLWVDGVLQTTPITNVLPTFTGAGVRIHGGYTSSTVAVPAVMGDVSTYESALADARILAHYEAWAAPWDGDTTGERIARILALGWPSDLLDIATGYTILGPAVLGQNQLQLLKGYEKAEQGRFFISRSGKATFLDRYYNQTVTAGSTSQATFSDDGSDDRYTSIAFDYDDRLIYNRVRASRVGGAEVEVLDQTSIDTYGEQVDGTLSGLQFSSDSSARAAAEQRLDRYKNPQLRVRPIELKLHGLTAAQQADVLDLELGHRVTVERTPQAVGSQIVQETIVEGISHRFSGGQWTTTLTLSPVDTRQYAIWGTTNWGGSAGWGY